MVKKSQHDEPQGDSRRADGGNVTTSPGYRPHPGVYGNFIGGSAFVTPLNYGHIRHTQNIHEDHQ